MACVFTPRGVTHAIVGYALLLKGCMCPNNTRSIDTIQLDSLVHCLEKWAHYWRRPHWLMDNKQEASTKRGQLWQWHKWTWVWVGCYILTNSTINNVDVTGHSWSLHKYGTRINVQGTIHTKCVSLTNNFSVLCLSSQICDWEASLP